MRALIIDGYTDEPGGLRRAALRRCLPEVVAGAMWAAEPEAKVRHLTADLAWRNPSCAPEYAVGCDLVVFTRRVVVPGKYVGGEPIGPEEPEKAHAKL